MNNLNKNIKISFWHFSKSQFAPTALFFLAVLALNAQTTFPTTGFTLPNGKEICITYEVAVDGTPCSSGEISNQATVSGSNFTTVSTDDPDTAAPNDATLTPFTGLTVGNVVFEDINCNDTFESGTDTGKDNVTVELYDDGNGNMDGLPQAGEFVTSTTTAGGGLFTFDGLCPGDYIILVPQAEFDAGGDLENFISLSGNADPDDDVDNDDNGIAVTGAGNVPGVATMPVTLAFNAETLGDEDGDGDLNTNLTVDIGFKGTPPIVINEVDSDDLGADDLEFVELYDGGLGNTCLDGLVLVFFNGGDDASYKSFDLDGFSTDANGYFVAGNAGVANVGLVFSNGSLQNGADAVALFIGNGSDFPNNTPVTTTGLIDAVVYDTNDGDDAALLVLLNASQPQVNEGGNGDQTCHSIQRLPNGTGGQRNTSTFDAVPPTPGTANVLPQVSIALAPANMNENDAGTLDFTVSRTGNTGCDLTVNFDVGGTATFSTDYTQSGAAAFSATAGTVTIASGSSSTTISIDPSPDNLVENDETVILTLQAGTGFDLGTTSTQTATIDNDDQATLTLTPFDASKNEGTGAGSTILKFRATLDNPVDGGFQANFQTNNGTASTADGDYTDNDGFLTFAGTAGEFQDIDVVIGRDAKVEPEESIEVEIISLSLVSVDPVDLSIAGSPQLGAILNDDQATLTILSVSQAEGNGGGTTDFNIEVELDNPVQGGFDLIFNVNDGTATDADDFDIITASPLTFAGTAGEKQTIVVRAGADGKVEADETVQIELVELQLVSIDPIDVTFPNSPANSTIQNDDSATLTLTTVSANKDEGNGNTGTTPFTFRATLDNEVQDGFRLNFNTNDGTATTADNDYVDNDGFLDFTGGTNENQDFTVQVNRDNNVEADETFQVEMVSLSLISIDPIDITFTGNPQTGTILNDEVDFGDAPASFGSASHNTDAALFLGATIDGETADQASANADGDDNDAEGNDDDGVTLPAVLIASTNADITVNASANGLLNAWVDFDGNGSFADAGEQVFTDQALAAGSNNLGFAVPLAATQGSTFARFRFDSGGGLGITGLASDGEVEDYQVEVVTTQFSIDDPMVGEGNAATSDLVFTVTRSNNASASSVDFAITGGTAATGDNDYQALAAGTLNFSASGVLSKTITVTVNGDTKVELDETVEMTLSNPVNGSIDDGDGTGTINNDDAATITVSNPSIAEGDDGDNPVLTFDITMSNPSDADVDFDFDTSDDTAEDENGDGDYQSNSGSRTLTPGQVSKQVMVTVNGDCAIESNEVFLLQLSNLAANGRDVSFAGTAEGTGTIENDDALPTLSCPADYSQDTDPGACNADVTLTLATVNSTCGTSSLEFRHRPVDAANNPAGPWSGLIPSANNTVNFDEGRYEIEWQLTDGSGTATCNHFLDVEDSELPVATCQDITVELNALGLVSIAPIDVNLNSSDNCAYVLSLDESDFDCEDVNEIEIVTLTATDPSNNSHSCTAEVTVEDNLPPTVLCANATVQLDNNGEVTITHATIFTGSSDNCGFVGLYPLTKEKFTCADIGPNTVTLNVFDGNGNDGTCSATLTVEDTENPTVACEILSLPLNANGELTVDPVDLFDATNSSDNCGTVNPVSLSQSVFNCGDEGANSITLTANDGNGNEGTCTGTITILPFITISSITVTDESCAGAGDGAIAIDATAGGGQLGFSIDGGTNFQFTNEFTNLTPGAYDIVLKVFGIPNNCEITDQATVAAGNPQATWYKDIDGDLYSDGNTVVSCSQPAGYALAADLLGLNNDCDDNDANEFPGQVWHKDADDDGYSDGTTQTACSRPSGHKTAAELASTDIDCDDGDPAVNPGATEICDGLDNDCDGDIDEGLSGETYAGNVTLTSQAAVDDWLACYSIIDGSLTILGANITDLGPLSNITEITGSLSIYYNASLASLTGLDNLATIGGSLTMFYNFSLGDCCAIYDLLNNGGVTGAVTIFFNKTGCNSQSEILSECAPVSPLVSNPDNPNGSPSAFSSDKEMIVYPNPVSSEFTVAVPESYGTGTLSIVDINGRAIADRFIENNQYRQVFLAENMVPGVYMVLLRMEGRTVEAKRFVVE